MFVAFNKLQIKPGQAEVFEAEFSRSMRDTLPGLGGLRRTVLLRPSKAGDPYLASMEFSDEAAYQAYLASAAFHSAHPGDTQGEPSVEGSDVRTYTVSSEVLS
ncbi:MAG: antibiotic biosynthesis monooxygenase family protein [Candidatus Dormibacteraceae bacterium]